MQNVEHRRMRRYFVQINEKINSKLAGWKARVLLQEGKTILIKPILQVDKTVLVKSILSCIPLFTMSSIKIPNNISKEKDYVKRNLLDK